MTVSTCLNVLSCCHVIGCISKQLKQVYLTKQLVTVSHIKCRNQKYLLSLFFFSVRVDTTRIILNFEKFTSTVTVIKMLLDICLGLLSLNIIEIIVILRKRV